MATTVASANSDNMADSLNTDIGTSHKLKFYSSVPTLLSTCTYSAASGVVSAAGNPVTLTYAHGNYTDDASPTAGTISYAVITTSGDVEVVRFSDPVNDIGLSSTTIPSGATMDVDTDIVIQMPNHT